MLRYYIEDGLGPQRHIYMEYKMGIKWIATLTDHKLAIWLTDKLNDTQGDITGEVIVAAAPSKEEIGKEIIAL